MNRLDNFDPLWSLKRAAEFLSCDTTTLRRYAKREGKIRFFQVGERGHLKFRQSELEKFLAQHSRMVANG
jgi:excisionase family DNA binding protein